MAKLATRTDGFTSAAQMTTVTNVFSPAEGSVAISSDRLALTSDGENKGIGARFNGTALDATSSEMYARIDGITVNGNRAAMGLWDAAGAKGVYAYKHDNGILYLAHTGLVPDAGMGVAYNATDHAWWRLSCNAGGTSLTFQAAPDVAGAPGTWTTVATGGPPSGMDMTAVVDEYQVGQAAAGPWTLYVDALNGGTTSPGGGGTPAVAGEVVRVGRQRRPWRTTIAAPTWKRGGFALIEGAYSTLVPPDPTPPLGAVVGGSRLPCMD